GTVEERYTEASQRLLADTTLPGAEKARQYRLLRHRQILETQVERGERSTAPGPTRKRQEAEKTRRLLEPQQPQGFNPREELERLKR
ncbi:MAG: hypothetical protein L0177_12945, partial [Chloroflexi bacterium]|nr:hypothetical protein [Chloroflexota bacterium]